MNADAPQRAPSPELHRPVSATRAAKAPMTVTVTATPAECAAIALRLGIVAVLALDCRFDLRRGDDARRGEIVAEGLLKARVVQDCVVTLEPFEAPAGEAFRVHFVTAGTETDEVDPEADDEIGYAGDAIDLGEAAVEQLALALDPYPRGPEADAVDTLSPDAGEADAASPFAALARRARDG